MFANAKSENETVQEEAVAEQESAEVLTFFKRDDL